MSDDELELEEHSLAYRYGLSDRQERFVHEYLIDLNAWQAAKRAGYSTSSTGAAAQIMRRANVRQAINDELDKRTDEYSVDHARIIQQLSSFGYATLTDFVKVPGMEGVPRHKQAALKKYKKTDHYNSKGELVSTAEEFELEPRARPLELLGKHVGMFRGVAPEDNKGAFQKWSEKMRAEQAEEDSAEGYVDEDDREDDIDDGAQE